MIRHIGFKFFYGLMGFLFLGIFFSSCGTKHNNFASRATHNLTSHYNGYFNAREIIKESERKLAASHEDKYDRLLPIFMHGTKQTASSVSADMDKAIEKSSRVIQRHSMMFKGREYVKWIDDNYLIIGKAKYYKREFYPSVETLQYIPVQYPKQTSRFEAMIYMILNYVETGNQIEAEGLVDYLRNEKKIPSKLSGFTYATCAHYYVAVKNYPNAIEMLTKAVTRTRKKADKARYSFILAQLNQMEGNNLRAYQLYNQVIRLNPSYDMTFNAKINRARVLDLDSKNSDAIEAELKKMLKEIKNKDYFDQIYFALAGIAMRRGQTDEAIKLLGMSINASTKNLNQKALSHLELAKIYFTIPDYRKAQLGYDSASTLLTKDHPDYEVVQTKKEILNRLIKNLNTIAFEDSMQALARLSPAELEKAIDKMIAREVEEEERKKREKTQNAGVNTILGSNTTTSNSSGSQWYFYNPTALGYGFSEFIKVWGNRKLEDDWRRSNKQVIDDFSGGDNDGYAENDTSQTGTTDRKKYTKTIPSTEKQLEASNNRIIEAFYNNAGIYREQLYDRKEAAKALEELLVRYPENKHKLPAYYQLYRMYGDLGNDTRSNYYKNLILNGYPKSEYARVILNPNYLKEMETEQQKLEKFYDETFNAYKNGQYDLVIRNKTEADENFGENELSPKFSFLKALSIGRTQSIDNFEASLLNVIIHYPKDPVKKSAEDIIDKIVKMRESDEPIDFKAAPVVEKVISYEMEPDADTYYVITYESGQLNTNTVKMGLLTYNDQHHGNTGLKIVDEQFGKQSLSIKVGPFLDVREAIEYFNGVSQNSAVFPKGDLYRDFLISPGNYTLLLEDQNVLKYQYFFKANYK